MPLLYASIKSSLVSTDRIHNPRPQKIFILITNIVNFDGASELGAAGKCAALHESPLMGHAKSASGAIHTELPDPCFIAMTGADECGKAKPLNNFLEIQPCHQQLKHVVWFPQSCAETFIFGLIPRGSPVNAARGSSDLSYPRIIPAKYERSSRDDTREL